MKAGIITPTNNLTHIRQLYESIKSQATTVSEIRWYIGVNGTATTQEAEKVLEDEAAKNKVLPIIYDISTLPIPSGLTYSIGAYKGFLSSRAVDDGCDFIVEVDHDDIIHPDCIERLAEEFSNNPHIGFVYSDTVEFIDSPDGPKPFTYSPMYGWESYPVHVLGADLLCTVAHEPSARSVCDILFAPNHVRAWRSSVYVAMGGHDPNLPYGDDHDLMIRTYLATEMKAIHEPLYYYRRHEKNTFSTVVDKIQHDSGERRRTMLHALVRRECELNGLLMLDLGAGNTKIPGYIGIDLADSDLNFDLSKGELPPLDGKIGAIRAFDFLEHLPIQTAYKLIQSCYDRLVPGGYILTNTPHSMGIGADCDPTHVSRWNEASFTYMCDIIKRNYIKHQMPWFTARFQAVNLGVSMMNISTRFISLPNVPYVFADLYALKGQKHPGAAFI
jgi:hypothetical protein